MDELLARLRVPTREEVEAERALHRKQSTSVRFEPSEKAEMMAYAKSKGMTFNALVEHYCRQGQAAAKHLDAVAGNGNGKRKK